MTWEGLSASQRLIAQAVERHMLRARLAKEDGDVTLMQVHVYAARRFWRVVCGLPFSGISDVTPL